MPLEALRYDITPVGLHYLLIHFDIPRVEPAAWRLQVGGAVDTPARARRSTTLRSLPPAHTMRGHAGVRRQRPRAAAPAADQPAVADRGDRDRGVDRHAAVRRCSTRPA